MSYCFAEEGGVEREGATVGQALVCLCRVLFRDVPRTQWGQC